MCGLCEEPSGIGNEAPPPRRAFLRGLSAGLFVSAAGGGIATLVAANDAVAARGLPRLRHLHVRNLYTDEIIRVAYREGNRYIDDGVLALDEVMRDVRTDLANVMDRRLYDLLFLLHHRLNANGPIELVSGYRSRETNDLIRTRGNKRRRSGVATESYHMQAQAADIRIKGRSVGQLGKVALQLGIGGVGLYSRSSFPFVHVDVGPRRRWGH
jgi:uncharacterized protein YcbK (DUF882 family)